mgnify:FL=1|jgi:hypothetical protein
MAYTTIDNPFKFFNTVLYTGANQSITGVNFQPDWVWIKERDSGYHAIFDSVRGATKVFSSNVTNAESTQSDTLTAFGTDGFTLGADSSNYVGGSSTNTVSWNWLGGTAFSNDASATGVGTIDSSGTTNQTAGFSLVSFTGNGSASQSVAHNLGGTPEMIIFKCRETATDWTTFHTKLGGANKNLSLNSTSAAGTDTDFFANTNPTSTVFSVGAASNTNRSSEGMIAYCFRSIKGYSKFGSYTGNGNADGTFVYTGFKPAFVIQKASSASSYDWVILDNKRDPFNVADESLYANLSNAAQTSNDTDFLSNGFKLRSTAAGNNGSGTTFIYMAFAESPFVTAGTKAAGTAR